MSATEVMRLRVEPKLKRQAEALFKQMGLTGSDALRLISTYSVNHGALPFPVQVPNRKSVKAITAARKGKTRPFNPDVFK